MSVSTVSGGPDGHRRDRRMGSLEAAGITARHLAGVIQGERNRPDVGWSASGAAPFRVRIVLAVRGQAEGG
jgi:hypothetical protein